MVDAVHNTLPPPLLPQLLAPLRRRWWLMPLMMVVITALVLVKLNREPTMWTAQIEMFPAPAAAGVAPRRGIAGIAAQAGGGLAALAGSLGGGDAAPPFRYFLDGLSTPEVAARLAEDPVIMHQIFGGEWNPETRQWEEPHGLLRILGKTLFGALGLPAFAWTPPDAERLQAYIDDAVNVRRSVKSPLVTITFDHWDRAFAASFLNRLVATADAELRATNAARTAANIAYLSERLAATPQSDARESLVAALAEEERSAMLSAAELPYAAEPFAPASVGRWPSRPRPLPLLVAGLIAGLLIGAALAVWLDRRRPPAPLPVIA
ncbi:hypothetical protein [Polymorphobacter sp.]|uniref:hypothetical protein n=1 Tax=Polymorphobacter sp. TaxID=1909290 RepID=UPI003F7269E7